MQISRSRTLTTVLGALALATASLVATSGAAHAAPRSDWAPAGSAAITPGVQAYTEGGQCTTNFVFTDDAGSTYIGYAAHCAGLGEATDTNGCLAGSQPLGTKVDFRTGGSLLGSGTRVGGGELVYSSWVTMAERGESDADACSFNDFALVEVDGADLGKVNPSVPFWGGPTGIDTDGTTVGERVHSYGNSSLRFGLSPLSPKVGFSLGSSNNGWNHSVYTLTPGIPGDSGSAFLDGQGRALGTLSTVAIAPLPASNGLGGLHRELDYAKQHSGIAGLRLVNGTEPFRGSLQ